MASVNLPEADVSYDEVDHQKIQQQQSDKQQVFLQQLHQQDIQQIQKLQQQAYATPIFATQQQLAHSPNVPYQHYPKWIVQKYNGIGLKPIKVSMLPVKLQPSLITDNSASVHHSDSASTVHPSAINTKKIEHELPAYSDRIERTIPAELQKLALSLGIHDLSKLPSLDEAMNLLGTTTPEDTISIIKEIVSTKDGREMIKQFMQSTDDDADVEQEEQDQQQLKQQQLVGNNYHKQPQLLQQQQLHHQGQRQPDTHQYLNPTYVTANSHSGPSFSSVYGPPRIRHPNQILQLSPTLQTTVGAELQHSNTNHGIFHNVEKPVKPSRGFFQAITDFFLPPPAEADQSKLKKSAVAPKVVPAQTISQSSVALPNQHPLYPTFLVQQQQQFQPQKQYPEPRHSVVLMHTIPNQSSNSFIDGFKGVIHTPPTVPHAQRKQPARNYPVLVSNTVTEMHPIAHPLNENKTITFQDGNEIQLPLDNYRDFMNTSQVNSARPLLSYSVDDDLDGSDSEQITAVVRVPMNEVETHKDLEKDVYRMEKSKNVFGFQPSDEAKGFTNHGRISNSPQRISSYDFYATGKINRADAEAMRIAIPTQAPPRAAVIR